MKKTGTKDKKTLNNKSYFLFLASYFLPQKGQSILEYTILLGVIVLVMFAMGPMLKRGTQSLIKVVADQVGVQRNAEQKFDETGHLEASYTATRGSTDKRVQDSAGAITYSFDDVSVTTSNTLVNLGYTEER